jgi:TPR repeat protein
MRVVLVLSMLLAMIGTALAGPAEELRAAKAAENRGDYAAALRNYRSAAEQGNLEAQIWLGYIFHSGNAKVPHDDAESAKWWRRAAEQGHAIAQTNIGLAYRFGQGVTKDPVLALMWFNLSAAQGYKGAAEELKEIASEVTPAQVAEAQKLVKEWKPKQD